MKVLVTGVKGQLGHDVVNELENADILLSVLILKKWTLQTLPVLKRH